MRIGSRVVATRRSDIIFHHIRFQTRNHPLIWLLFQIGASPPMRRFKDVIIPLRGVLEPYPPPKTSFFANSSPVADPFYNRSTMSFAQSSASLAAKAAIARRAPDVAPHKRRFAPLALSG
jgi:hypothetical protein